MGFGANLWDWGKPLGLGANLLVLEANLLGLGANFQGFGASLLGLEASLLGFGQTFRFGGQIFIDILALGGSLWALVGPFLSLVAVVPF